MTSDSAGVPVSEANQPVYVWTWLPGAADPVVAGVLQVTGDELAGEDVLAFRYALSYLERRDAVPLYLDLPLEDRVMDPRDQREALPLASSLRDAAPDAWGRRVINQRLGASPDHELRAVTYLLESGSDRTGALDFQARPDVYVSRDDAASLDELQRFADLVEAGAPIPPSLATAAQHGTSIGGARPKARLVDGDRQLIAKFSSTTDTRPVVKAEALAMNLARRIGLDVANIQLERSNGKDVLLVERFDRAVLAAGEDGVRGHGRLGMVSMLTVLGLTEMTARYASYVDMADVIRAGPWVAVPETLRELYTRLVLNVCVGNNDDHLRNHAAFWDGRSLRLTPAYDIAPSPRSTGTSSQAIGITRDGQRASQLRLCRAAAADFLLSQDEADSIIDAVESVIRSEWNDACDEARLTQVERDTLYGREFLNPYIYWDAS